MKINNDVEYIDLDQFELEDLEQYYDECSRNLTLNENVILENWNIKMMQRYVQEKKGMLTPEEEMCASLEGYVWTVMKKHFSGYIALYHDELYQAGMLGILGAYDKYDPSISAPTTFFYFPILHEMGEFINKNVMFNTSHYASVEIKINRYLREHNGEFGEKMISAIDLAYAIGATIKSVEEVLARKKWRAAMSIDIVLGDKEPASYRMNPERIAEMLEDQEEKRKMYNQIHLAFHKLSSKELAVVTMYYGVGYPTSMPLRMVAEKLNISVEEATSLRNSGMYKVKKSVKANARKGVA